MCEEKLEPEQEERGGEGSRKGEGRGFICALGYWLTRRHYTTSWTLPYVFTPAAAPYTTHLQPVTATRLGIHCHQHHITPHLLSAHAPRTRTERQTERERGRARGGGGSGEGKQWALRHGTGDCVGCTTLPPTLSTSFWERYSDLTRTFANPAVLSAVQRPLTRLERLSGDSSSANRCSLHCRRATPTLRRLEQVSYPSSQPPPAPFPHGV